MPKRRKPFTKRKNPRKLEPNGATTRVLRGIYTHEGILSHRQVVKCFFPGCTSTWPEVRMTQYFDHRLVKKHDASFVNGEHLGEIVYTLDTTGARYLSSKLCVNCQYINRDWDLRNGQWCCSKCGKLNDFQEPATNHLSLKWRKNPRWSTLAHDLKINDIRIAVMLAAEASPIFELIQWVSEYELSQGVKIPGRLDGFFLLRRQSSSRPNTVEELAILPEIDMGNHPLNRFVKRKVKPALSYIGSSDYERTFGINYGSCFVVTTGQKRLENLKTKTEEAGGRGLFYFTTFNEVNEDTVLTAPIWKMAGSEACFSLADLPLEPIFPDSVSYVPNGQLPIPSVAI